MQLLDIPDNPVPEAAVAGILTAGDGARIRYARWPAAASPTLGTVCILPGRAECIEKYFETVEDMRRRGFAVAVLDWRGQGGSTRLLRNRRNGHIDSFEQFDTDLAALMEQVVLPDCPPPYFALAHSMGGAVALRAATRRPNWFDRMVLSAPLVRIAENRMPGRVVLGLVEALCFLGLGDMAVPGRAGGTEYTPFEGNPFTSDEARHARTLAILDAAPELGIGAPTLGWVMAAAHCMSRLNDPDFAAEVRVPVVMVAAGDDRVVSNAAIETLGLRLKSGSHIVIPGARHELLMERDVYREQFLAAFDAFVPGTPVYG